MPTATSERDRISEHAKWNTRHLYRSDGAWERERKALKGDLAGLEQSKGTMKGGAQAVLDCLQLLFALQRRVARLSSYAWRRHDEDTRVPAYQAMRELAEKLQIAFGEASSFIEPELAALPKKQLTALCAEPRLADYERYLQQIVRLRPHILSGQEEALLASVSLLRETGHNAYSTFCGAELQFPQIADEKGRSVKLTQALFPRLRASRDRAVRRSAFEAYFGTFGRYRQTLASLLGAQVNANAFYARARRYDSALAGALEPDELPVAVYRSMVAAVNEHLPVLHRYLRLRRRLLGLRQLRYYDLYAPIVERAQLKVPYERGQQLLVEAMAPLGRPYCQALAKGLAPQSGWIDLYPNKGKRSGAYMDGSAYDVHPYVLGNYLDDYNSLSMLAHEMGHAMHSHYSNARQPYPKADYSIFVAEVASTLNEALLADCLLGREKSRRRQLFLLGEQLEGFRLTLFRQAMFAEFELQVYERAERGEALNADTLSADYLATARRYYGHDQRLVLVDDIYGVEWAAIPHFYYNFYVFQYVTGITAATALAERIREPGDAARDRYIEHLLSAGASDDPISLLRRAGVDLTTTEPYRVAMRAFGRAMDRVEELAAE